MDPNTDSDQPPRPRSAPEQVPQPPDREAMPSPVQNQTVSPSVPEAEAPPQAQPSVALPNAAAPELEDTAQTIVPVEAEPSLVVPANTDDVPPPALEASHQPPDVPAQPATPAEELPQASAPAAENKAAATQEVTWQAAEYIHHEKSPAWFAVLGLIALLAVAAAVYFGQWIFAVLIVVMAVALGVFARRLPRDVQYRINTDGISVGGRTFPFSQFRSFGILHDGTVYSAQLRPAKRFMPGVMLYFAEADGEKIYDALAARLPVEDIHQDAVDKFMRWLRF